MNKQDDAALEEMIDVYEKSVLEKTNELYEEIAKRKQAEEEIRHMSAIQNLILENSTLGIALVRNRTFEWVNARLGELLMLPLERIQGASTRVIYPSDETYEELGRIGYQNLYREGERSDNTLQLQRSDGTLFWCRFIGKALNPAKPQDGSIWMFEDITDRKEAEERIRHISAIQDLILENSTLGISLVRNRTFEWVNARVGELLMLPVEQIQGSSCRVIYPSDEAFEELGSKAYPILATGKRSDNTIQLQRNDGTLFWCRFIGKALNPAKPQDGSIWMFEDITERKQLEEALSRSEMYFRSLIENSTDIITILDADGTIRYDSPTIKRILGYEQTELVGRNIFEFVHPDDLPDVMDSFHRTIQNPGAIISTELRFRYNDGSWRILESLGQNLLDNEAVKGIVINSRDITSYSDDSWRILESVGHNMLENGAVKGIVMNSRDITERKKMQAELQKKNLELAHAYEELEKKQALIVQQEKMASIGMLAAGVAHEIKNPLAVVLQGVDYLQTAVKSDNLVLEVVERMNKAVIRADIIIKSLISYSRQNHLTLTEQNISALIDESLVLMEHELCEKGLQVIREYAPGLPKVFVDGNQLKQVFINLLLNGIDAMSKNGIFTIIAGRSADDNGNKIIEISFKDTGPGIHVDKIHKIFDPFYTSKGVSHTGLGLYTSREIIDKHGGIIYAESQVGEGTRIVIKLPISP